MLLSPYWWEADQLAVYKHDQGVDLGFDLIGSTEKQLQLSAQGGLEPAISGFQVQHPKNSATLPSLPPTMCNPTKVHMISNKLLFYQISIQIVLAEN